MQTKILDCFISEYGGVIQTGPFGSQLHQSEYVSEGIPVIMPKDIVDGKINDSTVARVSEQKAAELSRHKVKEGTIIFPRRGDISKCAYIKKEQEGYLCGTGCIKIEVPDVVLSSRFLFYYFQLGHVTDWLERNAVGTTMLNLNTSIMGRIQIPIIDIRVQEEIADILSAYDDLIENNKRRIALLEESARLLYREWFVNLRFPGHEHVKIIDGVPEGWRRNKLSDMAEITMGQSPKSEFYNQEGNGLPFHQGVTNFGNRHPTHESYCTYLGRLAEPGDILFSVRAPVGRINIANDQIIIGRGLAAVQSKKNEQCFLYYAMKSHFFKEDMIGGGAIYAAITKKDLHTVELVSPLPGILNLFQEIAYPIDNRDFCIMPKSAAQKKQ